MAIGADVEPPIDEDNPIEQVRLTVPTTDDPSEPCLTFRTWVLGLVSCCLLSFVNEFFDLRQNGLFVSSVTAQIISLPLGRLMASVIPKKVFQVPFVNWSFSLNPGPFTLKEHVLITIFANCGASSVYAVNIITILKGFYRRPINPFAAFLLCHTTQLLGYGWAGLFRKFLVESPYMWWPDSMITVSVFRALHEDEKRPRGGYTRFQFFMMVFVASFAYYLVPGYLFQGISTISIVCWIWRKSVLAQQLGSGLSGLGIGSFGLDWNAATFVGNPISSPPQTIFNILIGFVLAAYVMTPFVYYLNIWQAKTFPIISSRTFDKMGKIYNISSIINEKTFSIDLPAYDGYSKLYLSSWFALTYGLGFACLAATIVHVSLHHGKTIWEKLTQSRKTNNKVDVHTRLMRVYNPVPNWWFYVILVVVFCLSLWNIEGFDHQLQLPWWGLILACALAFVFTLPVGIIQATTNVAMGLNIITEMAIGYVYPGRPLANVVFKTYGYISMVQALSFLSDFKLGHYMKVPPRSMFIVQLVGTVVSSSIYFGTNWWLLASIPHVCDPALLPAGSPWSCPGGATFYSASIIWGVIGPLRQFTYKGVYGSLNYFFLAGALLPIPFYFVGKKFPQAKWIQLINIPVILSATSNMPPAKAVNMTTFLAFGIFFNWYIYKVNRKWWARHAYVMAAALNVGVAFMGVVLYFALQVNNISGPAWWGMDFDDHCPLASCPTAPGVFKEGCPVVQ